MKILVVSDQVVERLYTLALQGYFSGVELILGCGDLPYNYLEDLVSIINVPLFYVPGNHDPGFNSRDASTFAEGGLNLDLKVAHAKDLLLAGFGGCVRYRPNAINQYSQKEARLRAARLIPALLWNRTRYGKALDILITHAPAYGIHDDKSQAHTGLKAINWLIRWGKPRFHFHGHTHFFRRNLEQFVTRIETTTIMNVFPYKLIEI